MIIILVLHSTDVHSQPNETKQKLSPLGSGISLTITTKNPTCMDAIGFDGNLISNGVINISASGGMPPYTYDIHVTPPQENGYFPGLSAGTYHAVIKDANGMEADTTIILTNTLPQPQNLSPASSTLSSCKGSDGDFVAAGLGGTPPYQYSIDGGVTFTTNDTFANLTQGGYLYYIKDANGCMAIAEDVDIIYNGGYPCLSCCSMFVLTAGGVSCTDQGQTLVYAYGGTPPYQYSLDNVNFVTVNYSATYFDNPYEYFFTNLAPGLYHVYAKDNSGLTAVSAFFVSKSCYVAITYVGVDASCQQNDGSITVNANYGTPPYTYTIDGINYQPGNVFTGLGAGSYSITVTDANEETYSIHATIFNKCPTVTAVAIEDTCAQNKGSIIAHGNKGTRPYQFSIDGINFQTDSLFTGLGAGNYTVIIKDLNGFTSTAGMTVVNNCLQLLLTAANTTCSLNNGNINATASNGTAPYMYSIDGVNFQSGQLFNNLDAGNYMITAEDGAGLKATATITIIDSPGPLINTAMTPASCSNTGGSISIIRTGGTAPFQYSIDNGLTVQPDSIFNSLDSGQYIAFAEDANNCKTRDTIHLTALPTPTLFLGPDTSLCAGDTLILKAPQIAGYQYRWQDNSNGDTYTATTTGTYNVKVTNSFNCSASDTILVRFLSLPVFTLGDDTVLCEGQTLLLQPAVLPQGSYLWNTGSNSTTLRITAAGLYWLQVSGSGCAKSDSIIVSYKPVPVIALGNDTTLCEGQTLLLDATTANSTYSWQDGSVQSMYTVSSPGNYSVKVTENGCDARGGIVVDYIGKPSPDLVKDTTVCITQQLVLDASYPQSSYLWQDNSSQPRYTVTKAGLYAVSVTNSCGTSIDTISVSYDDCACKFYVPQAFTPNNDGRNDVFMPKYQCIFSSYELKVFNRWGQSVFDSKNPSLGWDGKMGGQPQPPGTYVWEMSYKDLLTGKLIHSNGTIILIR